MKRPSGMRRRSSMARTRFCADSAPQPSSAAISVSLAGRRKISAGDFSQPSSKNSRMDLSPSPSMSKARRETKWISRSTSWSGQVRPPVQRRTTSPGGRMARLPQVGQWVGGVQGSAPAGRRSRMTATICGITSPARCSCTVSPTRMSLRAISSSLCSVARDTSTPPTFTGSSSATGVSAPVRPTWMRISRSVVVACSAGNFQAIAQRGARPTKPSRRCRAKSSIL